MALSGLQVLRELSMLASCAAAYLMGFDEREELPCGSSASPLPSPVRTSERIAVPSTDLCVDVSLPRPKSCARLSLCEESETVVSEQSPPGNQDSGVSDGGTNEEKIVVDESDYLQHDDWRPRADPVLLHYSEGYEDYYERHEEIGIGKFGRVYRCTEKRSGREFAGKWIKGRGLRARREVEKEIELLKELHHPRIIYLHEVFAPTGADVVMLMERITGGELFERVVGEEFVLTETAALMILRQICEATAYIHTKSIVHLDLKPENILFLSLRGNRIKVIDFGLAQRVCGGETENRVVAGTAEFISPEVVNYEPVSLATDIWSIGVIAYILLSGVSPFLGEDNTETYVNVTRGHWDFDEEAFASVSPDARDFVARLIRYKKEERLSAEECLDHSWLRRRPPTPADERRLSTERLASYVARARWKKALHALSALRFLSAVAKPQEEPPASPFSDFDNVCVVSDEDEE